MGSSKKQFLLIGQKLLFSSQQQNWAVFKLLEALPDLFEKFKVAARGCTANPNYSPAESASSTSVFSSSSSISSSAVPFKKLDTITASVAPSKGPKK